jgi:hypothetical protein
VFLAWLERLVGHLNRKIHLIVDGHPVHQRVSVREWLDVMPNALAERVAAQVDRDEIAFVPRTAHSTTRPAPTRRGTPAPHRMDQAAAKTCPRGWATVSG